VRKKELLERKIGENKSKIGSSLSIAMRTTARIPNSKVAPYIASN